MDLHQRLSTLQPAPVFLAGPTGSGKTAVGIELAERLGAEIISMDSMAVYRHLTIGTAKPTAEEQARVRHHLVDIVDPWTEFSVHHYLRLAAEAVDDITARGRRVLFVGGTPLYLKALLHGLESGPPPNPQLRQELADLARRSGPEAVHHLLSELDPLAARRLHPHDLKRVIRAIEFYRATGRSIVAHQQHFHAPAAEWALAFYLDWPRTLLYERINARTRKMFASGWVEEVRRLRALPRPLSRTALQAHGYRPIMAYLDGHMTLEEAIELTARQTRQYAKRQLTWLRHMPECEPVPMRPDRSAAEVAAEIVHRIEQRTQRAATADNEESAKHAT